MLYLKKNLKFIIKGKCKKRISVGVLGCMGMNAQRKEKDKVV